ncbi:TagK domain-containing protein [Cronobacter turicensis]|uniref:TagK domain-containing protein n=1 Tax=Cronobacter turicensis TaxID=413502 RepID=UPI001D3D5DC4|nr:TagK domain-containing protein [Cronobacter turicensis]EGT5683071.1 TagK domain-containing protein [Cronobacter turicensis]EGT5739444.1 TagK domain-containing protein [Cronobacter turicensis]ELY6321294.1 TagK domain-containing protein [Cronobacter turicensis]MDI6430833.1 TagK domain-containing protein [Cronobacter turicensis]
MQIRFIWPENGVGIRLNEQHQEVWLDIDRGAFSLTNIGCMRNSLVFSLRGTQPYMMLSGTDYVCLAGDEHLAPGQPYPLRYGLTLQAGRYALQVTMATATDAIQADEWAVREVDALLARSMRYVDWARPAETQAGDDILKILESEYKRFLAWGEQRCDTMPAPVRTRLKYAPADFALLREQMQDKTLTECILGSSHFITHVLEALSGLEPEPGVFDPPRYDILKIVAPDAQHIKAHTRLPALTVREFHQPDLDSLL